MTVCYKTEIEFYLKKPIPHTYIYLRETGYPSSIPKIEPKNVIFKGFEDVKEFINKISKFPNNFWQLDNRSTKPYARDLDTERLLINYKKFWENYPEGIMTIYTTK